MYFFIQLFVFLSTIEIRVKKKANCNFKAKQFEFFFVIS